MTGHVPAWKKLGLKLKYANDEPVHDQLVTSPSLQEETSSVNESNRKRKRDQQRDTTVRPKRLANHSRVAGEVHRIEPVDPKDDTPAATSPPATHGGPKRKKSVSFAPDTKPQDGDSAQSIQFLTPDSPGLTPKKPKREKQKTNPVDSATEPALPKKSKEALDYLSQHYHDRSVWKFNKNREVWILKHALSGIDVPASHNAPLSNYIHGLRSTGARERLMKECQNNRPSSESNQSADGDLYLQQLTQFAADLRSNRLAVTELQSEEYSSWIKQQARADLILWALSIPTDTTSEQVFGKRSLPNLNGGSSKHRSPSQTDENTQPRVKKNKARTSRIEFDSDTSSDTSSSDDDETSSSGSSSSDDEVEMAHLDQNRGTVKDTGSSTSESETSSSSGLSDTDNESGSSDSSD